MGTPVQTVHNFEPDVQTVGYSSGVYTDNSVKYHGGATRRSPRIPQLMQWFTNNRLIADCGNNDDLRF